MAGSAALARALPLMGRAQWETYFTRFNHGRTRSSPSYASEAYSYHGFGADARANQVRAATSYQDHPIK